MTILTESDVENKGLDYVKSLNKFEYRIGAWQPTPHFFKKLESYYNIERKSVGNIDNGYEECIFTRKPTEQQLREKMQKNVEGFEKRNDIKILGWEFADVE